MLDRAILIAVEAHTGQKTANGEPYILHPLHVMNQMRTMDEKIVAVLHDVVEDTDITFENLIEYGFKEHQIEALRALYHPHGEPYLTGYIERVSQNWLAINVKIEDLRHNMNLTRLVGVIEHRFRDKIFEKYIPAYERLLKTRDDFFI